MKKNNKRLIYKDDFQRIVKLSNGSLALHQDNEGEGRFNRTIYGVTDEIVLSPEIIKLIKEKF